MSDVQQWAFPTRILFGAGAVTRVGEELSALDVRRALVVTDAGVRSAGLLDAVTASLEQAGLEHAVFDGVAGNPVEANVHDGHAALSALCSSTGTEQVGVVAFGGGSAMDVAKLVSLVVHHRRPLVDYDDASGGAAFITGRVPPIVAIPTTAGTGSEVGRSAVVTLDLTGRKTVIFSPRLLPSVALIDPEMTRSLPPFVTAATGYDALTHCLEALVARGDHPMADAIALGGIRLVARSLARAVAQGDDLSARGDMMKAAMMGAVAFQKGLGACHSLAHPLSNQCGLHHGLANALCLPAVVRFNQGGAGAEARRSAYDEVASLLGGGPCDEALARLRADLGLPGGLGEAGVDRGRLEALADAAMEDACHTLNPRPCTRADMLALYEDSW